MTIRTSECTGSPRPAKYGSTSAIGSPDLTANSLRRLRVVDEGRAARLLRGIAERVDRLAHASEHRNTDSDSLWLDGVKYLFVTAIEGSVDLAHHIISSESWGSPDTNAAALRLLGVHGVLSSEIAASVSKAVGFRNILVHQYAKVDDEIVMNALDNLDDLRTFVSQVSAWVIAQRADGER